MKNRRGEKKGLQHGDVLNTLDHKLVGVNEKLKLFHSGKSKLWQYSNRVMNEKRESSATIDRKKVSAMQSEYSNNREKGCGI